MDSALKQILKDEKKRKEERDSKSDKKERKEKKEHKSEKSDHRSEHKHKSEKPKSELKQIDLPPLVAEPLTTEFHENETLKFIFVFEDSEGNLFNNLDSNKKVENSKVVIFPCYLTGQNENLNEEEVTFTNGKFVPNEENKDNTWLSVITSDEYEVMEFDLEEIVVYNNKFYHCVDDLIEYIQTNGAEYLPVSK